MSGILERIRNYYCRYGFAALVRKTAARILPWSRYSGWIRTHENPSRRFDPVNPSGIIDPARFSIITPCFNTPFPVLKAMLESVRKQTYPFWEHCLAIAGTNSDEIRNYLKTHFPENPKIKTVFLKDNHGIAENSNAALVLSTGDFVLFLDHDDTLAPNALEEAYLTLIKHPDTDFIYSDEDKITADGRKRFQPFFKPDFAPDTLRSMNYIGHAAFVRKSLGDAIGWFRSGFNGSQDYDLFLRITEKTRRIIHIPKILYHWRAAPHSTALDQNIKGYSSVSGVKALESHAARIGWNAEVTTGPAPGIYRVRNILKTMPPVSIVIPNRDHSDDLKSCVESILQSTGYPDFEIIILENGSIEEKTFLLYHTWDNNSGIRILRWDQPFNYSEINNFGAENARGSTLVFLNNDTEVLDAFWLEELVSHTQRPEVGCAGARLLYPDGSIQHGGVIVGLGGGAAHAHKGFPGNDPGYFRRLQTVQNVSAVTGACLAVRKVLFREAGGFDRTFRIHFGDTDFCLKLLRKGCRNIWSPFASLLHKESRTRGRTLRKQEMPEYQKELWIFRERWKEFLEAGDPYYNPNLTLSSEDFSLKL